MTGERIAPKPLPPVGPELGRRNRRIIAERTGWPEGAAEACDRIEDEHGGTLEVAWFDAQTTGDPQFHREAGFYAWLHGKQPGWTSATGEYHKRSEWYGATAEELEAVLRERFG